MAAVPGMVPEKPGMDKGRYGGGSRGNPYVPPKIPPTKAKSKKGEKPIHELVEEADEETKERIREILKGRPGGTIKRSKDFKPLGPGSTIVRGMMPR